MRAKNEKMKGKPSIVTREKQVLHAFILVRCVIMAKHVVILLRVMPVALPVKRSEFNYSLHGRTFVFPGQGDSLYDGTFFLVKLIYCMIRSFFFLISLIYCLIGSLFFLGKENYV